MFNFVIVSHLIIFIVINLIDHIAIMLYEFNRQITKLLTKSGLRDKSSFDYSIPWLQTQIRFLSWWQTYVHTYIYKSSFFSGFQVFLGLKDKVRSIDISLDLSIALSLGDLDNFTMCALRGIVKEQWSVHAGIQILTVRQAPTLFQIFYPHPSHFILFTDFLPCSPSSIPFHPWSWLDFALHQDALPRSTCWPRVSLNSLRSHQSQMPGWGLGLYLKLCLQSQIMHTS